MLRFFIRFVTNVCLYTDSYLSLVAHTMGIYFHVNYLNAHYFLLSDFLCVTTNWSQTNLSTYKKMSFTKVSTISTTTLGMLITSVVEPAGAGAGEKAQAPACCCVT